MRLTAIAVLLAASAGIAQDLEGVWLGTLGDGETAVQLLFLHEKSGSRIASTQRGTWNDMTVTLGDGRVRLEAARIKAVFEGRFEAAGREIDGVWTQGGVRRPLRFVRYEETSFNMPPDSEVDVHVRKPPVAVRIAGRYGLFYEVFVTNWSNSEMTLERVEVLIGGQASAIEGDLLKQLSFGAGTRLGPHTVSGVLMYVSSSDAPASVSHRVAVKAEGREGPLVVDSAAVPVSTEVVRIAPPVRGARWKMGNGPDSSPHHRGSIAPARGRIAAPQRFAFDIARVAAESAAGKDEYSRGDPLKNENHPSFGAEVLAVADATVVAARNDMPDNVPYDVSLAAPVTGTAIYGNYVVLDLGASRYAVYGHLQQGSVRVKAGEKVRRGEAVARIGNSGRCDAPHLHFQVADGPDLFSSEGIPFVFDSFRHEGSEYRDQMPAGGWTIEIP